MAGSINLSLSQQFDKLNGNLLSGGRLYFYAAGTDAPQNAYKDTGLTLTHPNPIILASDGRVPQLYFADGSIHVRLTDNGGVVQFDEDFILVVGPSSGGGGGGGGSSVDATAIFQTGMWDWQPVDEERSGWVRANGRTIGSASSGALERHNADTQALFEYLYGKYTDSLCPVSGGRTGNATNDFNSNKTIGTIDARELMTGGLSTMGNSNRGSFSAVPVEFSGSTTPGGIIGEIVHSLSVAETAAHNHTGTTDGESAPHTHRVDSIPFTDGKVGGLAAGGPSGNIWYGGVQSSVTSVTPSNDHTHSFTTTTIGASASHNNTPRTMLGTFYIKL